MDSIVEVSRNVPSILPTFNKDPFPEVIGCTVNISNRSLNIESKNIKCTIGEGDVKYFVKTFPDNVSLSISNGVSSYWCFLILIPEEYRRDVYLGKRISIGEIDVYSDRVKLIFKRGDGKFIYVFDSMSICDVNDYSKIDKEWKRVFGFMKNIGISNLEPYTIGRISSSILQARCLGAFGWRDNDIMGLAYSAYRGGRMEAISLGIFDDTYCYDINRAYGGVLKDLQCARPPFCKWIWKNKYIKESTYGFAYVEINLPEVNNLGIILVHGRNMNKSYFMKGRVCVFLSKPDMDLLYDLGIKMNIYRGVWGFTIESYFPFHNAVSDLIDGDMKIFPTVMVGKIASSFYMGRSLRAPFCFNPVYTATITSEIRSRVFKRSLNNRILSFSIDGIISEDNKIKSSNAVGRFRKVDDGRTSIFTD